METATVTAHRKGPRKSIEKNANKQLELFSQAFQSKIKRRLGHIIRTENEDPLRQVSLQSNTGKPTGKGKRRSRKPRQRWIDNIVKQICNQFRHEAPKMNSSKPSRKRKYKASTRQSKFILEWAKERQIYGLL
jgi:hypothetical protein